MTVFLVISSPARGKMEIAFLFNLAILMSSHKSEKLNMHHFNDLLVNGSGPAIKLHAKS